MEPILNMHLPIFLLQHLSKLIASVVVKLAMLRQLASDTRAWLIVGLPAVRGDQDSLTRQTSS